MLAWICLFEAGPFGRHGGAIAPSAAMLGNGAYVFVKT